MSRTIASLLTAAMFFTLSSTGRADEMCATRVQNNDTFKRAIDHLQIAPVGSADKDQQVVVNRIVMPGRDNVTAIHWNCASHAHAYTIVGMSAQGSEIVRGQTTPATTESQTEDQPLAELATSSH